MENVEVRKDNENIHLNYTPNSNEDNKCLVQGQPQSGREDDDVLAVTNFSEREYFDCCAS